MVICCFNVHGDSNFSQNLPVAPVVAENITPPPDLASQTLKSLGMVLLFLGVLLVASWYVRKRSGNFALRKSKRIKVLDRVVLDMRHSLALISVDGANYLIGVAPQSITAVAEIKKPAVDLEQHS